MSNRTITVFYDGSHYIFRWLKALFLHTMNLSSADLRLNMPIFTNIVCINSILKN